MNESQPHIEPAVAQWLSSLTVNCHRPSPTCPLWVVAIAALVCSCSALPPRCVRSVDADPANKDSRVFLIRRGWHVDVALAAADLGPSLRSLQTDFPAAHFLVVGFGDRRYLLHKGHGNFLAALWPGPGLVLVTGVRGSLEDGFGQGAVVELQVSRVQLDSIQQFVWRSLTQQDGRITPLQDGPYAGSLYYESTQRYSGLHTCNTWAAQAMQAAGLPIRSVGVELAGELWSQVLRLERAQRPMGQGTIPAGRSQ